VLICNPLNIFVLQVLEFQAPPGPGVGGGRGKTCTKTFLGQVGMCVENIIKIVQGFGFPLTHHIPTDGQTNKLISGRPFLYIEIFAIVSHRVDYFGSQRAVSE